MFCILIERLESGRCSCEGMLKCTRGVVSFLSRRGELFVIRSQYFDLTLISRSFHVL